MELKIDIDQYLKKFIVRPNQTLFELSAKEKKDLLIKRRCLVCGNKLRIDLKGNGRCVSKKNNCKFFIRAKVLAKYEETNLRTKTSNNDSSATPSIKNLP